MNADLLIQELRSLHKQRRSEKSSIRSQRRPRRRPSLEDRGHIWGKTSGRCHVCGDALEKSSWRADHIVAHSRGGHSTKDDYLPAHKHCNSYRRDYLPKEAAYIQELGVWLRTEIERDTKVGREAAEQFVKHERNRKKRRKAAG